MAEVTIGNGVFRLVRKIGEGAFGQIYFGVNVETNEQYAIKLENANSQYPQLFYESQILQYLYHHKNGNDKVKKDFGIPRVYYCFKEDKYNVMVMDVLGPSLEELF